jgi:hypothetical protein
MRRFFLIAAMFIALALVLGLPWMGNVSAQDGGVVNNSSNWIPLTKEQAPAYLFDRSKVEKVIPQRMIPNAPMSSVRAIWWGEQSSNFGAWYSIETTLAKEGIRAFESPYGDDVRESMGMQGQVLYSSTRVWIEACSYRETQPDPNDQLNVYLIDAAGTWIGGWRIDNGTPKGQWACGEAEVPLESVHNAPFGNINMYVEAVTDSSNTSQWLIDETGLVFDMDPPTLTPTATSVPTETSAPTDTPVPTYTATPTNTPVPPTPASLEGVNIIYPKPTSVVEQVNNTISNTVVVLACPRPGYPSCLYVPSLWKPLPCLNGDDLGLIPICTQSTKAPQQCISCLGNTPFTTPAIRSSDGWLVVKAQELRTNRWVVTFEVAALYTLITPPNKIYADLYATQSSQNFEVYLDGQTYKLRRLPWWMVPPRPAPVNGSTRGIMHTNPDGPTAEMTKQQSQWLYNHYDWQLKLPPETRFYRNVQTNTDYMTPLGSCGYTGWVWAVPDLIEVRDTGNSIRVRLSLFPTVQGDPLTFEQSLYSCMTKRGYTWVDALDINKALVVDGVLLNVIENELEAQNPRVGPLNLSGVPVPVWLEDLAVPGGVYTLGTDSTGQVLEMLILEMAVGGMNTNDVNGSQPPSSPRFEYGPPR